MNPDTGHLIDIEKLKKSGISPEEMLKELLSAGYEEVPPELEDAARKKLAGKPETWVSLNSSGKLSNWAAKQRKVKSRRKMARKSRRRNRR